MADYRNMCRCTPYQRGEAASIRSQVSGKLKHELNQIVHSGDVVQKYDNKYFDGTDDFDFEAQKHIERAKEIIAKRKRRGKR